MNIRELHSMISNRLRREEVYSQPEYWDSKAEHLAGKAVSMWRNNHLNELYHAEQTVVLSRILQDVRGLQVLDIGCGTGRVSRHLAAQGAQVNGFDFSPKAIELARQHSSGDNPKYRVLSLFDLDDYEQYDVILSWGTVAIACRTRVELADAMERLYRALKAGGTLAILEPLHSGFLHRVLNMSLRDVVQVVQEAGFQVHNIYQLHFWPMRLVLAYIRWPRWITAPAYHIGQAFMKHVLRNRVGGDYKAIVAVKNSG